MSFKTFLIEGYTQKLLEKHDVVLQQIIDALDDGHIDYSEDKIDFDIGSLINQPKLKGLGVAIRKGGKGVRLGQNKNGGHSIVIGTDRIPARQDIDGLLASKDVFGQFGTAYNKYMNTYFDKTKEYDVTDTEKFIQHNNRDGFEGFYNELLKGIQDHTGQYDQAISELDKELESNAHAGRKMALEQAKKKLRDEYIGATDKDFISKVLKLPQAEFSNNLDKDWRSKLEGRLGSYYASKYSE
ncbi:hypothetical protein [Stenotrophomonas phage RAS14]